MDGTSSFACSSLARYLLATPHTGALLPCSYGPKEKQTDRPTVIWSDAVETQMS